MKRLILIVLGLAMLALSIWGFFIFFESYEEEVSVGLSSQARKNPYLAAQFFLKENQVTVVEETDRLDFSKIDTYEIVFLSNVDDMILTESQIQEALEWVNQGGFLIVGVGAEIQGNASILERFDIDPIEYDADFENWLQDDKGSSKSASERMRELNEKIEEQQETGEAADEELLTFQDLLEGDFQRQKQEYSVELGSEYEEIRLQVLDRIVLNHPLVGNIYHDDGDSESTSSYGTYSDNYSVNEHFSDEKGTRFLKFSYGEGTFTALSSARLWQNDDIGQADHAAFLAFLVSEDRTIRLFYNVLSPSLAVLLKRNFIEVLLISALLLVLWLWRSSLRVQGIRSVVTTQRRAFSEHLKASAEFLLSKEQYSLLLEPIHNEINSGMRIHYPSYMEMSQSQQIDLITKTTQLPNNTIQAWFNALSNVKSQEQMIAIVKIGNAIRNKI